MSSHAAGGGRKPTEPVNDRFMLWRRIDAPGHDACRLQQTVEGWRLRGVAVFRHQAGPAQLAYEVCCDSAWRGEEGRVEGWIGERTVAFRISRALQGSWLLNGTAAFAGEQGLDLDFGFTPATNLFQLRRLDLAIGQAADAPAAWLDIDAGTLSRLSQRYERRSDSSYWYQAPSFGYAALLETTPAGFIHRYPGLWEAEA